MYYHNDFHIEMKKGLINDPNGLAFFEGKYYIFFQYNPENCTHKNKHWGLVTTTDFKNYEYLGLPLKPVDYFDKNGCYSGSARVKDGKLQIFYTANLKKDGIRYPSQVLAEKEGNDFIKKKIIIKDIPKGYTAHFRDPFLFTKNGRSFLILGGQRLNETGCVLCYEEIGGEFTFLGEIKTNLTNFGYMWECPNLITIDGKDILIFCPQGLKKEEYKYRNLYQAGYICGNFDENTLTFSHGDFVELDCGFDFYAPQVLNKEGEHILWGWVGMPEEENTHPTTKYNWVHSLTMPRKFRLESGKIVQKPIVIFDDNGEIKEISLTKDEELLLKSKTKISISIEENENFRLFGKNLEIFFEVLREEKLIKITRTTPFQNTDTRFMPYAGNSTKLDIYIDNSILEIYNESSVATLTYYKENEVDDFYLKVYGDKKIIVHKISAINIKNL